MWRRLQLGLQVPYGGTRNHLLLALLFIKVKIKDPKTFRGRVNYFISAISNLELDVVSDLFPLITFVSHLYFLSLLLLF